MMLDAVSSGHAEPVLQHQFLRGCVCGAPHPLVNGTGVHCLRCGRLRAPPDAPITVPAVLTDWHMWLGIKLIAVGRWLSRLSRGPL